SSFGFNGGPRGIVLLTKDRGNHWDRVDSGPLPGPGIGEDISGIATREKMILVTSRSPGGVFEARMRESLGGALAPPIVRSLTRKPARGVSRRSSARSGTSFPIQPTAPGTTSSASTAST